MDAIMTDLYNTTLFNIKTYQCWADLYLWESFMSQHGSNIKSIIELGTYHGGMSIMLLLHAVQREMKFWTFDYIHYGELDTPLIEFLNIKDHFVMEDIRQAQPTKLLSLLADEQNHPLLLYCDNGAKEEEFQKYVVLLKSGDYIGVHDWMTEVYPSAIEPYNHLIQPVMWVEFEAMQSHTRFWRLK